MFIEMPANKRSIAKRKLVLGVGINDAKYQLKVFVNNKSFSCPYYQRWMDMLKRCYSNKYQEKQPTYKDCSVCDDWLIFSNFKVWMVNQDWRGNQLDKDLKFTGNKIYSPDTCIFVSRGINTLLNNKAASRGDYPQGVTRHNKKLNKFMARCSANGKSKDIGCFDTPDEASKAYKEFKSKLILSMAQEQKEPLKGYLIRISKEFKN
jgi:hypothetical protein